MQGFSYKKYCFLIKNVRLFSQIFSIFPLYLSFFLTEPIRSNYENVSISRYNVTLTATFYRARIDC